MRYMGIDLGTKRVGVAISDEGGLIAMPLLVIEHSSLRELARRLGDLIQEHHVDRAVVGLPLCLDGTLGLAAIRAQRAVAFLRKELEIDILTWDERLSTCSAERVLLEAGVSRGRRRQVVDKIAAAVMLQSFLDARQGAGE